MDPFIFKYCTTGTVIQEWDSYVLLQVCENTVRR